MFTKTWNTVYTTASPTATPHEQWYGVQPSVKNFRVPLCDVTFHRYKDERKQDGTFDDRASQGVIVGYAQDQRSYLVLSNGVEYKRRFEDASSSCDERSKLTTREKLRRRKHYYDSDSEDTGDGYESSSSSQGSGDEDRESKSVPKNSGGDVPDPQTIADQESQKLIFASIAGNTSSVNISQPQESQEELPHNQETVPSQDSDSTGQDPAESSDELPTRLIRVVKYQAKWGAGRIAKHAGVSFEELSEYNSNLKFNVSSQFRVGTELTVPIRSVDSQTLEDVAETANTTSESIQTTSFEHAYFVAEGSGKPMKPATLYQGSEQGFQTSDGEYCFNMQLLSIVRPRNYRAAHHPTNPHSAHWAAAEKKELDALSSKYVERSIDDVLANGLPIGRGMWQYAVKPNKLKARWCYDGSSQSTDGLGNIAAEVLRYVTCRMILILAVHYGHAIEVLDVSNAFLHRKAPKPFHMYHPPGHGSQGTCMEWNYLLYGRREAPMGWQEEATEFALEQGFEQSKVDPRHFFKTGSTPSNTVHMGIFVDDFLLAGPESLVQATKKAAQDKWPTTSGPIETYLGMQIEIDRDTRTLKIHQSQAIEKFLKSPDMRNCKTRSTF